MASLVKLMSLTEAEFRASLAGLDRSAQDDGDGWHRVTAAGVTARVRFEALPKRRLGGLVAMPQARVTLDLTGLTESDGARFLRAFDIAFQRGGG